MGISKIELPPSIRFAVLVVFAGLLVGVGYWRGMEHQKTKQDLVNTEQKAQDNEELIDIQVRNERLKHEDEQRADKILKHADPVIDAPIPDDLMQSFRDKVNGARKRANIPLPIRRVTGWDGDSGADADLDRQTDNDFN